MRNLAFAFLLLCSIASPASANDHSKIPSAETSEATANIQSLNLAEAGLDAAMQLLNSRDTDGWELIGCDARLTASNLAVGDGATGELEVLIENWSGLDPVITAEGRVIPASGLPATRQLRLNLRRASYFPASIVGQCGVSFDPSKPSSVESYRSWEGRVGSPNYVRRDRGVVATTSIEAGALDLGNSSVWGYVFTGGQSISAGPHATVQGEDSPPLPLIDPHRVVKDFTASFPQPSAPPLPSEGFPVDIPALEKWIDQNNVPRTFRDYVNPADIDSMTYRTTYETIHTTTTLGVPGGFPPLIVHADEIDLNSGNLRIVGPVVLVVAGDVRISGGARLEVGFDEMNRERAYLLLYVDGDVSITGTGGLQNFTRFPFEMTIVGTAPELSPCNGSQSFNLGGNASWEAVVYAPNANIHLNGGGSSGVMAGAVVGMNVNVAPGSRFYGDEEAELFFRGFWEVLPAPWEQSWLTNRSATMTEASQPAPSAPEHLEFRLHFSNTRSVPPDSLVPERWSVSADIRTRDPDWESRLVVSSPNGHIQAFINAPEGPDSRSAIFDLFESMVAAISGTWTIDIDPDGEESQRYFFTVDTTRLLENRFAHFGIRSPSSGSAVLAGEFQADWLKPALGTWNSLGYQLYHLDPYKIELGGNLPASDTNLILPELSKAGRKRLTIVYKDKEGGFAEAEIGVPYNESGPAPFEWHVGPHTSFSRSSRDFQVISHFQRWLAVHLSPQEQYNPETGGLLASPRGDGLTNLEKYALGMAPFDYDSTRLPALEIHRGEEPGDPDYLILTFRIVADDPALGFAVAVSSDLNSWVYSDSPDSEVETELTDNEDGTLSVSARVPKRAGGNSQFMRLLLRYD